MRPLYGAVVAKHVFTWSEDTLKAFSDTNLVPEAPVALTIEASDYDYAVGAIFEQLIEGTWQLLASF